MNRRIIGFVVLILVLVVGLGSYLFFRESAPAAPEMVSFPAETPVPDETPLILPSPEPSPFTPEVTPEPKPETSSTPAPKSSEPPKETILTPVPEKIHKELIPKNIDIVRFYYSEPLTGPGRTVEFDINGSGFTDAFEKMISVDAGHPTVSTGKLKLITVNQIHGQFVVSSSAPTGALFPHVLIQDKVVFRAPDPYAVIRPGEVLNLVFTRMDESGRAGEFRIYTNLTPDMYSDFEIVPGTTGITVDNIRPNLPYIVDARINIGWVVRQGQYGLALTLGEKTIWERDGLIRLVAPNVGQTGLVQQMRPVDGFHRPGDKAPFVIQGSGFQPTDPDRLRIFSADFENLKSTITFIAPGRLDVTVEVPKEAKVGSYGLSVYAGETKLLNSPNVFRVVPENWAREFRLDPVLVPGGGSALTLVGRDFDKKFIENIEITVDHPGITIEAFKFINPDAATAVIRADSAVTPGDYWLKMTSSGTRIQPQNGSIIRVHKK